MYELQDLVMRIVMIVLGPGFSLEKTQIWNEGWQERIWRDWLGIGGISITHDFIYSHMCAYMYRDINAIITNP